MSHIEQCVWVYSNVCASISAWVQADNRFFVFYFILNNFVHFENAPGVCFCSTNVSYLSRENNGNITVYQLQLWHYYNMLTSYISSQIINQPLQHNPLFRSDYCYCSTDFSPNVTQSRSNMSLSRAEGKARGGGNWPAADEQQKPPFVDTLMDNKH